MTAKKAIISALSLSILLVFLIWQYFSGFNMFYCCHSILKCKQKKKSSVLSHTNIQGPKDAHVLPCKLWAPRLSHGQEGYAGKVINEQRRHDIYPCICSLHADQTTGWLLHFLSLFTIKSKTFRSENSYIRPLTWFSDPGNL